MVGGRLPLISIQNKEISFRWQFEQWPLFSKEWPILPAQWQQPGVCVSQPQLWVPAGRGGHTGQTTRIQLGVAQGNVGNQDFIISGSTLIGSGGPRQHSYSRGGDDTTPSPHCGPISTKGHYQTKASCQDYCQNKEKQQGNFTRNHWHRKIWGREKLRVWEKSWESFSH